MAYPDFRCFLLNNVNDADVVYPMVWDQSGTGIVWDGSLDSGNQVLHGIKLRFDLNLIGAAIPDQTIVTLGCKVKDSGKEVKDKNNKRTYVSTSQKTPLGNYEENGTFSVDPAAVAGLDTATSQDAYLKLNNPAVAKLLVSVADLISPELA